MKLCWLTDYVYSAWTFLCVVFDQILSARKVSSAICMTMYDLNVS